MSKTYFLGIYGPNVLISSLLGSISGHPCQWKCIYGPVLQILKFDFHTWDVVLKSELSWKVMKLLL